MLPSPETFISPSNNFIAKVTDYLVVFSRLLQVALLNKTWMTYTVSVGVEFVLRIPLIKNKVIIFRTKSR